MKKLLSVLLVALAVISVVGCVSKPTPPPVVPTIAPFEILQHKGTTLGVVTPPAWIEASLNGAKAVEKLPDYANKYVFIVEVSGQSLDGVNLAAQRLNADTEVSRFLSIRVKDAFAGAQVGDKDKIETYMERVVKSVSEAKVSGYLKAADWWVQIRWYKPDGKKTWDKDEYRLIQLYTIDKTVLDEQLKKIMSGEAANEPKTAEKQRAMDAVQGAFYEGF